MMTPTFCFFLHVLISVVPIFAETYVVGSGIPTSCTENALRKVWDEVAGLPSGSGWAYIEFNCGPPCGAPVVISLNSALIMNRGSVSIKVNRTGYSPVVLDGQSSSRILVFGTLDFTTSHNRVILSGSFGKEVVLEGLTFRNGKGNSGGDWGPVGNGGCVVAGYGAELQVKQCNFRNCRAAGKGGGIHAETVGMLVEDSIFTNNNADQGGGFFNTMIPGESTSLLGLGLLRSEFSNNEATGAAAGFHFSTSAVEVDYVVNISSVLLSKNTVRKYHVPTLDRTLNGGGAGVIKVGYTGTLEMSDVVAESNTAGNGGAFVMYIKAATLKRLAFIDNLAYGNKLDNGDQAAIGGGAIFLNGGPVAIHESIFEGNSGKLGGAIMCQNAGLDLFDCSFVNNAAISHLDSKFATWNNRKEGRGWQFGGHGGAVFHEQWGADGTQDGPTADDHVYKNTRCVFQGNSADNSGGAVCGGFYDHAPSGTNALRHTLEFRNCAFCGNFMNEDHPDGTGSGAVSKLTGGKHRFVNTHFGGNEGEPIISHCCCLTAGESGGHCVSCEACSAEEEQYENSDVPPEVNEMCKGSELVSTAARELPTITPPFDHCPPWKGGGNGNSNTAGVVGAVFGVLFGILFLLVVTGLVGVIVWLTLKKIREKN